MNSFRKVESKVVGKKGKKNVFYAKWQGGNHGLAKTNYL